MTLRWRLSISFAMVLIPLTIGLALVSAAVPDLRQQERGESGLRVTVSIGAAVFPLHAGTATSLLRAADDALYAAKEAGRDTWRLVVAGGVAGGMAGGAAGGMAGGAAGGLTGVDGTRTSAGSSPSAAAAHTAQVPPVRARARVR